MQDYLRNAAIILGHVICVLILLYCFANANEVVPKESQTAQTVELPSTAPTATSTPMPTVTVIPTPEPTPTETPGEAGSGADDYRVTPPAEIPRGDEYDPTSDPQ